MKKTLIDLTGKKFGKWTVIERYYHPKYSSAYWVCQCSCEHQTIRNIKGAALRKGQTLSCRACSGQRKETSPRWSGHGQLSGNMMNSYRQNAKRRGLKFNLSAEEAWVQFKKQDGLCALTGQELFFPQKNRDFTDGNASLDRVDNTKGYSPDNIQWVLKDINRARMDLSIDEFIELCYVVVKNNPR